MSEHPILFSGPMVRAILEGRKTQTRRPVKLNASGRIQLHGKQWHPDDPNAVLGCPYGQPGDILWVRETWQVLSIPADSFYPMEESIPLDCIPKSLPRGCELKYAANYDMPYGKWRPSIHMPRWASRIDLRVKSVRIERVQDITEDDVKAEGMESFRDYCMGISDFDETLTNRELFKIVWDSINANGGYGWDANPWAWAIEFERVERGAR
jgi:hypothetical protein